MNITLITSPILIFALNILDKGGYLNDTYSELTSKRSIDPFYVSNDHHSSDSGAQRKVDELADQWTSTSAQNSLLIRDQVINGISQPLPCEPPSINYSHSSLTSSASQAVESIANLFSVLSDKNTIPSRDEDATRLNVSRATVSSNSLLNNSEKRNTSNLFSLLSSSQSQVSQIDESLTRDSKMDVLSMFTFEKQLTQSELIIRILGAMFCIMLIATTIFGNTLVLIVVVRFHRMRTVTNILLASLAIADITVAIFVMPFLLMVDLIRVWPLGWLPCHLWISCDVMCCTASILHLCAIAIDRFWAITRPLRYRSLVNKRRLFAVIAIIWFASAAISFIPIFSGLYHDGTVSPETEPMTDCSLKVNQIYAVVSSMTSFYLPLPIMFYVYFRILLIAKNQVKGIRQLQMSLEQNGHLGSQIGNLNRVGADFISMTDISSVRRDTRDDINLQSDQSVKNQTCIVLSPSSDSHANVITESNVQVSSSPVVDNDNVKSSLQVHKLNFLKRQVKSKSKDATSNHHSLSNAIESLGLKRLSATSTSTTSNQGNVVVPSTAADPATRSVERSLRRRSRQLVTDTKAIRTLGIVMGVFCACWFPFFIMYLVGAFCTSDFCDIRYEWRSAITWLGYVNSSINPLIYSFTNKEFKLAFKRVICCTSSSVIFDYNRNLHMQDGGGGGGGRGGGGERGDRMDGSGGAAGSNSRGINCYKSDQLSSHYRSCTTNDPFNVRYFSSSRTYNGIELDAISSASCTGTFSEIPSHVHSSNNIDKDKENNGRNTSIRCKAPVTSCLKASTPVIGSYSRDKSFNVVFDIPSSASSTVTADMSGVRDCLTTNGSYGNSSIDSTSSSSTSSPATGPFSKSYQSKRGMKGDTINLDQSQGHNYPLCRAQDYSITVDNLPQDSSRDVISCKERDSPTGVTQSPHLTMMVESKSSSMDPSIAVSVISSPLIDGKCDNDEMDVKTCTVSRERPVFELSASPANNSSSDPLLGPRKHDHSSRGGPTVGAAGVSGNLRSSRKTSGSNKSVTCQRASSRRFRVFARQTESANETESINDSDIESSAHRSNVSLLSSQWSLISMGDKCNALSVQEESGVTTMKQVTSEVDNSDASSPLCPVDHPIGKESANETSADKRPAVKRAGTVVTQSLPLATAAVSRESSVAIHEASLLVTPSNSSNLVTSKTIVEREER